MADPPKAAGMSLYADLLDPDKKTTGPAIIASAPVRYNMKAQESPASEGKKKDGAYQIPAYLRPQIQNMKAKATPPVTISRPPTVNLSATISKPPTTNLSATTNSSSPARQDSTITKAPALAQKSKYEDWVGREDEEITYQRPSWNRQKKNKKKKEHSRVWSWNDIYDPSLPNNYADYKGSDEQFAEIRDWKARLYYHQLKEINQENKQRQDSERAAVKNPMFAPPTNLNFAPPSFDDKPPRPASTGSSDDGYYPEIQPEEKHRSSARAVSFAPSSQNDDVPTHSTFMQNDTTEENASARGAQQSTSVVAGDVSQAVAGPSDPPKLQPVVVDADFQASAMAKVAAIKAKLDASIKAAKTVPNISTNASASVTKERSIASDAVQSEPTALSAKSTAISSATISTPPSVTLPAISSAAHPAATPEREDNTGATISRAPVRYTQAPAEPPTDTSTSTHNNEPVQSTSRPGQKNFAERYMQKFGYEKGKGLGAQGEGIVTPIIMKAEKRKKRSDADGGGWAVPANMGKIVGGKKRKLDGNQEDEVEMSPVVKIQGMVDGLDIDYEMQENDLMQRIGDTLSQDHGNIERIFIWREAMGGNNAVFVKFNSAVSALGAVNRAGGISFSGNVVTAVFFSAERFDKGDYA